MTRTFKYYPEDFGELKVKVHHMDLLFDVYEDHSIVTSTITMTAKEDLTHLDLNAKNLEIEDVQASVPVTYEYKDNFLKLTLDVKKDEEFTTTTKTICRPTANILEGLYYDETPVGAPKQLITQCQQWGFQRIVPCIDDMTAKCTYTTKIRADERYTNIITNGDLKKKVANVAPGRVEVHYDNTVTPMATYLFFLGCGTYATFTKTFTYPDGKEFQLELLVPPKTKKEIAEQSLEALADAVMWVHVFTGKGTYENMEKREKLWKLHKEGNITEGKGVAASINLGYKYTGTVYREIGMQNSDFGGMENVGNTTITTNRIMPHKWMTDRGFYYMLAVKAHEYYHNLNGSEVTGHSPFEIWLNEAVTVFIEEKFQAFVFGEDYLRLESVLGIIEPHSGTLAQDNSPASMPIEPDGFNDPNELITGITYVKAPEFVRMIETLMGKEQFVQALHNYHTKYKHSNATWQQWIDEMETVAKQSFQKMTRTWLKKTGWPTLDVKTSYDNGELTLTVTQDKDYEFPFRFAVFTETKEEHLIHIKEKAHTFKIKTERPRFVSFNRGFSFFGKTTYEASREEYIRQVREDDDPVAKFLAFDALFEEERTRLIKDENATPDTELMQLYHDIIMDDALMDRVGVQLVSMFESVNDESYAYEYQKLYDMRERLLKAIAESNKDAFLKKYRELKKKTYTGTLLEQRIASMKDRQRKNTLLALLARLDTDEVYSLLEDQFYNGTNASDRIVAFRCILDSTRDKTKAMEYMEKEAENDLVAWEVYLGSVAGSEADEVIELMKKVESSKLFRIEQANDQRALYSVFSHNRRKSLCTKEGRQFLKEAILRLAKVNEYNTVRILDAFNVLHKLPEKYQEACTKLLQEIVDQLNPDTEPSVVSYIKRTLNA